MTPEYRPLLQIQRDLLALPRGRARFDAYTAILQADLTDVPVPLTIFNPMAREHVAGVLDELLAIEADALAREALREAAERLPALPGARTMRVSLVVADDERGGWTDRYLTDARYRFQDAGPAKANWMPALLWSSEPVSAEKVREVVLAAAWRGGYQAARGVPQTLAHVLVQEGGAARFGGAREPGLEAGDLAFTQQVLAPLRSATDAPTMVAAFYGDVAARSVGHTPLGLSAWAGLALAIAEA